MQPGPALRFAADVTGCRCSSVAQKPDRGWTSGDRRPLGISPLSEMCSGSGFFTGIMPYS